MPIERDNLVREVAAKVASGRRTWVKRQTLCRWAGLNRASTAALDEIEHVLVSEGFGLEPLPLRTVRPDERVTLSPCPLPARQGLPLARERDLEDLLLRYWRLIPELAGLSSLARQKQLLHDGRVLKCDLYGRDSRGVVLIELKLGGGGYRPASQIHEYIKAEQKRQASLARPRPVRGIVISAEANAAEEEEVANWAMQTGVTVDWYYFALQLILTKAAT